MVNRKLHLRFPNGAPRWAHWGRRVRIGDSHYRVGRASEVDAVLWREGETAHEPDTPRERGADR